MSVAPLDAISDALDICSDLGFEIVPGFSTHWAMGSETLTVLGHSDLVHHWATTYRDKRKHLPYPAEIARIDPGDESSWRAALGDFARVSDWRAMFLRELFDQSWREVLLKWWPRLVPGIASGLFHGLLRTMHAIRSISLNPENPSQLQLQELATGLGYWAALYVEQPGGHRLLGGEDFPQIVQKIPRLPKETRIGTREKGLYRHMKDIPGWVEVANSLNMPSDVQAALSDMTSTFARLSIVRDKDFPIPLLHTISGPAAVRQMLHYLPEELHLITYTYLWEACAALVCSFTPYLPDEADRLKALSLEETLAPEALIQMAVEHGDEHAIKFTEACLREYRLRPDPAFLVAPASVMPKILRLFR